MSHFGCVVNAEKNGDSENGGAFGGAPIGEMESFDDDLLVVVHAWAKLPNAVSRNAAVESRKVPKRGPSRKEWRSLWPDGSLGVRGAAPLSLAWTNWPLFTVGLVQRGYKDEDIQKIIGGNVLRVTQATLKDSVLEVR